MAALPLEHILTLYNGIDLSAYGEHPPAFRLEKRRELGLNPDSVVAVTVADAARAKRHSAYASGHVAPARQRIRACNT